MKRDKIPGLNGLKLKNNILKFDIFWYTISYNLAERISLSIIMKLYIISFLVLGRASQKLILTWSTSNLWRKNSREKLIRKSGK